jgi:mono/diheme cytochrome c family protein
MPDPRQPKSTRNAAILLVILFAAAAYFAYTAFSNNIWAIPLEAKAMQNPIHEDPMIVGKQIMPVFLDKCAECHGETGQGNGPQSKNYEPRPSILTDTPHLNTVTDGELFYTISEGHKPMPSYKKKLTEDQRWQLVLLIRAFSNTSSHSDPQTANSK